MASHHKIHTPGNRRCVLPCWSLSDSVWLPCVNWLNSQLYGHDYNTCVLLCLSLSDSGWIPQCVGCLYWYHGHLVLSDDQCWPRICFCYCSIVFISHFIFRIRFFDSQSFLRCIWIISFWTYHYFCMICNNIACCYDLRMYHQPFKLFVLHYYSHYIWLSLQMFFPDLSAERIVSSMHLNYCFLDIPFFLQTPIC